MHKRDRYYGRLKIEIRFCQGQTIHTTPEARASGPAAWRGPELEDVKFLSQWSLVAFPFICQIVPAALRISGIWSRTLDINNAVPLLESLKEYIRGITFTARSVWSAETIWHGVIILLKNAVFHWRNLKAAPRREASLSPRESFGTQVVLPICRQSAASP